jgi:hypothetical protein
MSLRSPRRGLPLVELLPSATDVASDWSSEHR